eukprot:8101503-Karenia_brevis.AAC.1
MPGLGSFHLIRAVTVEFLEFRTPWSTRHFRLSLAWHQRLHVHITEETWKGATGQRTNMSI